MPKDDNRIRFFSVAEVADCLGVSTRTIRRSIRSGDLAAHKFRGVVRISEPNLRRFVDAHRNYQESNTKDARKQRRKEAKIDPGNTTRGEQLI